MNKIGLVCVIDDDPIYTFSVKRIIHNSQIAQSTLFFANGQLALDFFAAHAADNSSLPDLILLDINMPVLDGWQFADEFTRLSPQIKKKITIIIVSSSIDEDDYEKARSYDCIADYMVKPFSVQMLQDMLDKIGLK